MTLWDKWTVTYTLLTKLEVFMKISNMVSKTSSRFKNFFTKEAIKL
jgi:hypothetical protein